MPLVSFFNSSTINPRTNFIYDSCGWVVPFYQLPKMAQDWQVIAFTQREKLVKYPHELGLFDGSPSKLVLPLTVPVLRFDLTKSSDVTSSGLM